MARSIDRFGFASISTPFVTGPSEDFSFDLGKKASEYFDLASKAQGSVRHYDAETRSVQVAVQANVEEAMAVIRKLKNAETLKDQAAARAQEGVQKKILKSVVALGPAVWLGEERWLHH